MYFIKLLSYGENHDSHQHPAFDITQKTERKILHLNRKHKSKFLQYGAKNTIHFLPGNSNFCNWIDRRLPDIRRRRQQKLFRD